MRSYFYYTGGGGQSRTKLDGVQKTSCSGSIGEPAWSFTYYGPKDSRGYSLAPGTSNHDIDHWGFYNYDPARGNNDHNGDLTPAGTGMVVGGKFTPYGTANREPYEVAMRQGMLRRVTYPTGGHLKMEYEANRTQVPGRPESAFGGNLIALPGEDELEEEYTFTYTAEVANSTGAEWKFCISTFGQGGDDDDPGGAVGVKKLRRAVPKLPGLRGEGGAIVRNMQGEYVGGGGLNPREPVSGQCEAFAFDYSAFEVGETYTVELYATNASITFGLQYPSKPGEALCGGMRIGQSRVHDGIEAERDIVTSYTYEDGHFDGVTSGILFHQPKYAFRINDRTAVFTAMSQAPLYGLDGLHMGYRRVVVSQAGNGYTEYEYEIEEDDRDLDRYPVLPASNKLANGAPLTTRVYDQDDNLITATNTSYLRNRFEAFGGSSATGYFFVKRTGVLHYVGLLAAPFTEGLDYRNLYSPYQIKTGAYRPNRVTTTVDGVSTTTDYRYHENNLLPKSVTTTNSNGDEYKQESFFVVGEDYAHAAIRDAARTHNLVHLTYQTLSYHNDEPLDGSKLDYRFFRSDGSSPSLSTSGRLTVPRPYRQHRFARTYAKNGELLPGKWQLQSTIAAYNEYGQVREQYADGWTESVTNYNGQLPASTTREDQTTSYRYYGEETATPDDDTRRLKQVIHVDGTSTSYTYDDFGRLETVTDDCRGIVTKHSYQFKWNGENINYVSTETTYPKLDPRSKLSELRKTNFLDGLGRPIQSVSKYNGVNPPYDMVVATQYDRLGRVEKYTNRSKDSEFEALITIVLVVANLLRRTVMKPVR